ncbi:hypothetical protein GCM10010343_11790 [Streptomyces avidinii]|nr:hypothetical protein GCM10010343_11790 [Streptomyces avidinii]
MYSHNPSTPACGPSGAVPALIPMVTAATDNTLRQGTSGPGAAAGSEVQQTVPLQRRAAVQAEAPAGGERHSNRAVFLSGPGG